MRMNKRSFIKLLVEFSKDPRSPCPLSGTTRVLRTANDAVLRGEDVVSKRRARHVVPLHQVGGRRRPPYVRRAGKKNSSEYAIFKVPKLIRQGPPVGEDVPNERPSRVPIIAQMC